MESISALKLSVAINIFGEEKIMTHHEIAEDAIRRLNKRITNEIFLIIQKDRDLMLQYLRAVESNKLDSGNRAIG